MKKVKWLQVFLLLLIVITLLLPLLDDDLFQYCLPVFLLMILALMFISKNGLEILFSILVTIFFVVSLFARGAFLYLSSSFFIITTIAFIVIKRNSIFKPNLNKILLFSMLSIILSFYIIKPSLYTEVPMVPMSFDDRSAIDEQMREEEQSFCPQLLCGSSCYSILVLEDGKKKCRVCYNSIYLGDHKYRCKSIVPMAVITCLVFSYLISSLTIYSISKYRRREVKK